MTSKEKIMARRERLVEFVCDYLNISQRQFLLRCGLSETWIRTWKGNMTRQTRKMIEKAFPELNVDWVLTGEGDMITEGKEGIVISNSKVYSGNNTGNTQENNAGRDIFIGAEDGKLREEIASLKAKLEEKEKQLQEQRNLINMLIEKMSNYGG